MINKEILLNDSLTIMDKSSNFWAFPFIIYLEKNKKHESIYWVLQCVKSYFSELDKDVCDECNNILKLLEEHLSNNTNIDVDSWSNFANKLFSLRGKGIQYIILSKIYVAETAYYLDNYDNYIKQLLNILWAINDEHSKFIKYFSKNGEKCIELFENYIKYNPLFHLKNTDIGSKSLSLELYNTEISKINSEKI